MLPISPRPVLKSSTRFTELQLVPLFTLRATLADAGREPRSAIISPFYEAKLIDMEAERLNAIEGSLADLRRRAGELRGYL